MVVFPTSSGIDSYSISHYWSVAGNVADESITHAVTTCYSVIKGVVSEFWKCSAAEQGVVKFWLLPVLC